MICAISFTDNGKNVASELLEIKGLQIETFSFHELTIPLKDWCENAFKNYEAIIFIGAVGIATRLIAPNLKSKTTDPAVIVIDEKKQFVIPILSGHIGGANELSQKIADYLGSVAVITTATDLNSLFAVDVFCKKNSLYISNMKIAKEISAKLLKGEKICIYPNEYTDCNIPKELLQEKSGEIGIYIGTNDKFKPFNKTLNAIPKNIFVGVGMKKGTNYQDFKEAFLKFLTDNNVSINSVKGVCSVDLKKDEKAIIKLSEEYNIPTVFYSGEDLNRLDGDFSNSSFVKSITGTSNVCEKSAYLASGKHKLITKKTIINHITFALAQEKTDITFIYNKENN